MGGKANKKRRKQQRLRARRSGQSAAGPADDDACPLYRNPPGGRFYSSWLDCGSLQKAMLWAKAVMGGPGGADPDVSDLARRMPFLASVYGRMVPAEAAYHLDRCLDQGTLAVQWAEDGPVTVVPAAEMAPPLTSGSAAETRVAIHDLHARGLLMIDDDGTVIPLVPAEYVSELV
jgi:hypothetical protein